MDLEFTVQIYVGNFIVFETSIKTIVTKLLYYFKLNKVRPRMSKQTGF
jgi:hypothetical protein